MRAVFVASAARPVYLRLRKDCGNQRNDFEGQADMLRRRLLDRFIGTGSLVAAIGFRHPGLVAERLTVGLQYYLPSWENS